MIQEKMNINGIPAILWGPKSDRIYLYVHGKSSCKEYAEEFAKIAEEKGYQTLSFDLPAHGERKSENRRCDIWNGMQDLTLIGDYVFSNWSEVSLFACSLGSFFSLNTYGERNFQKCLFQSPIVDMEYLIHQMMLWSHVSEEQLFTEKEIETPLDLLSWDYYQYVREHSRYHWDFPTYILYGAKDNLQSLPVMKRFADRYGCQLSVSENSEHPFMAKEDIPIVANWIREHI